MSKPKIGIQIDGVFTPLGHLTDWEDTRGPYLNLTWEGVEDDTQFKIEIRTFQAVGIRNLLGRYVVKNVDRFLESMGVEHG